MTQQPDDQNAPLQPEEGSTASGPTPPPPAPTPPAPAAAAPAPAPLPPPAPASGAAPPLYSAPVAEPIDYGPAAAPYVPTYPTFANGKPAVDEFGNPVSDKSRLAAALLAFFFGWLGVHRFYVGKIGTGILMILTLGGLGIWALIDTILILAGVFSDKQGRKLHNW